MRALALATVMAAAVLLTAVVAAVTPVVLMVVVVTTVAPVAVGGKFNRTLNGILAHNTTELG